MSWDEDIKEIKKREEIALEQGGKKLLLNIIIKAERHKRETRFILDKDSFDEIGKISGSANYNENNKLEDFIPANFLIGFGKINNKQVIIGGEDFTLKGGSPNPAGLRKSIYTEELALKYKLPLIGCMKAVAGL